MVEISGIGSPIICARFFNRNGSPLTNPVLVGPTSAAPVDWMESYISVAISNSHKAVVAWHGMGDSSYRTFAQLVDPANLPIPWDPITVGSDSNADYLYPTVAMDQTGRTVIAWLKSTSLMSSLTGLSGTAMFQRFETDFTKRGGALSAGDAAGIPVVAWSSASNTFLLSAHTAEGHISASTFAFDTGIRLVDPFKVDARWNGHQHRPIVVPGANGEFMVSWMDDVTLGSQTGSIVTAQVFRGDFVPENIDFTVSTQTSIDQDNVPDLALNVEGFGFSAGGSGNNSMAVVWQKTEGIAFQRVSAGPFDCPQPNDCKTAVPWRITGPTADKLNVLLGPGNALDGGGQPQNPFHDELEFSRMAVEAVVNGLFVNDVIRQNAGKINFFRGTENGTATDDQACTTSMPYYNRVLYNFLDVMGNFMKGPMNHRDSCTPSFGREFAVITGGGWDPNIMHNVTHEFSHSAFSLSDEYDCSADGLTARVELSYPHIPNLYGSLENCQNRSAHPADCVALAGCAAMGRNWYVADKNEPLPDIMSVGNGLQYKEDCERNPKRILAEKK